MNWHRYPLTLFCILILSAVACAQEAAAPALPPPRDPVIKALLGTNPSSPNSIARLIKTLIDLKEPRYALPLVQKLSDLNLNEDQLAALHREVGSAFFVKIATQPELQPLGNEFATRVLDTLNTRARDPQRIADLVEKLADPSTAVRRNAIQDLMLGQDAAVQVLLAVLVDDNRSELHQPVQQALSVFGAEAFEPIAVLVRDGGDNLKLRAIEALALLDHPDKKTYALAPAFSPKSSAQLRSVARRALGEDAKISEGTAAARLYRFALEYYNGTRTLPADAQGMTAAWRWDAAANKLELVRVPARAATNDQAVRFSRDALLIVPENRDLKRLYYNALVEAALASPRAADAPATDELPAAVRDQLVGEGVAWISESIADAIASDRPNVAMALLRLLGNTATADILRTADGHPGVIVQALRQPHRGVRFAALETIAKLGPSDSFPGISYVGEALQFFIATRGEPRAVVGDPRSLYASALAGLTAPLGMRADIATDDRSAVRLAIHSADVEAIVLDMLLAAPTSAHLLSSLRRDARTAEVPIVIVVTDEIDVVRADAMARRFPRTAVYNATLEGSSLKTSLTEAGMVETPAAVRLNQAVLALNWLTALDVRTRELYGWRHFEPEMIRALDHPALNPFAIRLLGEMNSAAAQTALVEYASNEGQLMAQREAAASAFRASVSRHGILLTSRQMLAQYDRYNASELQAKAVQDVLASILDTLEGAGRIESPATSITTPQ